MKVLVTGGAGYIGSVMVDTLIDRGAQVVVLDNLSQGHREAVNPRATFAEGDLADMAFVNAVFREHTPEAVMHFAARSLVGESMREPFAYIGDNVTCGLNVLRACASVGVRRFVLSSTANLFGTPQHVPIDENERIAPGSPYGESKHILERMLHWMEAVHGMRYAALRYFNAAGATARLGEDHSPETHLIPIVLEVAQGQRGAVTVFGDDYPTYDGTCVRDYIHVSDLAEAHLLALNALESRSCVYNLGNGRGFSVREVIETARRVTGRLIATHIGPRREGDPAELIASSGAISRDLGFAPRIPRLDDIVRSAWRWRQLHPDGYGS